MKYCQSEMKPKINRLFQQTHRVSERERDRGRKRERELKNTSHGDRVAAKITRATTSWPG